MRVANSGWARWTPLGRPLSAEQTEALRFNPWSTGPGIHPSGWLNLLRDAAYRASQRGRQG
jgi:hypothetical protein